MKTDLVITVLVDWDIQEATAKVSEQSYTLTIHSRTEFSDRCKLKKSVVKNASAQLLDY